MDNINKYKKIATTNYNKYKILVNKISIIRIICFIFIIIFYILGYKKNNIYELLLIISIITFIILIIIHNKYYKQKYYYEKYITVVDKYLIRLTNNWHTLKETGEKFYDKKTTYLKDLDIIGNKSLYQYLNLSKTYGGKKKLYDRFTTVNKDTDAILELSNNLDFCIDYQIELENLKEDVDLSQELNIKKSKNNKIILFLIPISLIILTILIINIKYRKYIIILLLINYLINYIYTLLNKQTFNKIDRYLKTIDNIKGIYNVINKYKFTNKKLKKITNDIKDNIKIVNKYNKIEIINNLKNNILSDIILNSTIFLNIILINLFNKNIEKDNLEKGINIIYELESMISLSLIAVVKDNICKNVETEEVTIEYTNLYHPLIKETDYIPNSFKTNNGINIITGSNMGGKSTFIKTIGINLVLSSASGLVNAKYFKSTNFKIFTSIKINDNLTEGISTFYEELLRAKNAIEYTKENKPMIFIVDEIFKGTNYNDRISGATKVINKLNNKNIIVLITTHDFELCDIKNNNIKNYHFKEYYKNNKINFDYKLYDGKCTSTNALYLMKELNIID